MAFVPSLKVNQYFAAFTVDLDNLGIPPFVSEIVSGLQSAALQVLTSHSDSSQMMDLLQKMENHGIGTDATQATHIEKVVGERGYAVKVGDNRLKPTELGEGLVAGYSRSGLDDMWLPHKRAETEADVEGPVETCRSHITCDHPFDLELRKEGKGAGGASGGPAARARRAGCPAPAGPGGRTWGGGVSAAVVKPIEFATVCHLFHVGYLPVPASSTQHAFVAS